MFYFTGIKLSSFCVASNSIKWTVRIFNALSFYRFTAANRNPKFSSEKGTNEIRTMQWKCLTYTPMLICFRHKYDVTHLIFFHKPTLFSLYLCTFDASSWIMLADLRNISFELLQNIARFYAPLSRNQNLYLGKYKMYKLTYICALHPIISSFKWIDAIWHSDKVRIFHTRLFFGLPAVRGSLKKTN